MGEDWDRVLNTNLRGMYLMCKYVVPGMLERKYGKIVNIASYNAVMVDKEDWIQRPAYNASKAGIVGLTKALAGAYAKYGITANAVGPGLFPTEMDTDLAVIFGREGLAEPKKLGVTATELKDGRFVGTVSRFGQELLRVEADVVGPATEPIVADALDNFHFKYTINADGSGISDAGILKNGLVMDDMEGIWLAWATDPAAVQAMLPPCVDFAVPVVMSYIVKADTKFAGKYNEAAMIIPCVYQGKPSAILQSLLLCGPGAPQALYFGREMAGMPKKICDDIQIDLGEETASATIVKGGIEVLKCQLKLGEYNTPAGNEMFGNNIPDKAFHQDSFLMKYNLEQYDDGHIGFENGRVLTTENDTLYEYWKPATAEIQLAESESDPWASLPVGQVLAAGVGKYSMYNFFTYKIGEFDAEENAPYLLRARFDGKLFV